MKGEVARGAAVIAIGGLISKIIGAIYRVPLTNIIGAEGIGLYQMVFPVYCALLTFSSTGLPTALSKLVAEKSDNADGYLRRSLLLFGSIGLAGSVLMFVLGGIFARLQGNASAGICYRSLSPSVFTVSVISCIRGYFQGKGNMRPTAVSQIAEQVVKTCFGLAVCPLFSYSVQAMAAAASFAVTLSEIVALIYLAVRLKLFGYKKSKNLTEGGVVKKILALTVPVSLTALMLPLGHIADSFIVINIMGGYTDNATALYGIYSGSVAAITGVPIAIAYGVAVACIPALARGGGNEKIAESMRYTGFIAIPFALFLLCFAGNCINLIYAGMGVSERYVATRVLMADSVSVIFLSFIQTTNALLTARGRQKIPFYSLLFSLVARVALCFLLCSMQSVGILGAVIAANISYMLALAVNCYFIIPQDIRQSVLTDLTKSFVCAIMCVIGGFIVYINLFEGIAPFIIISIICALIYIAFSLAVGTVNGEIGLIRFKNKRKSNAGV